MKKLSRLVALTCLLVTLSGTALAWNDSSEGRPKQSLGQMLGTPSLSIWHDKNNEFHVKATNLRNQHVFTGVIKTDGRFFDIDEKQLENGDFIKIERDRDTIRFRFTGRGVDEFKFKVSRGDTLKFDLNKDGRDMPSKEIFIGKEGIHPRDNVFCIK